MTGSTDQNKNQPQESNPVGRTNTHQPPPAHGLASGLSETAHKLFMMHRDQFQKKSGGK